MYEHEVDSYHSRSAICVVDLDCGLVAYGARGANAAGTESGWASEKFQRKTPRLNWGKVDCRGRA